MRVLSKYLMEASFGEEYHRLKNRYPTWGRDLHRDGHIMESTKLAEIFHYGLLWWYIHNIDIFWNAKYLESNIRNIYTYDIQVCLQNLGLSTEIVEKIRKERKFKPAESVYDCLCQYPEKDALVAYIKSESAKIKIDPETLFQNLMKESELTKLGIFFQRSKIILEKIVPNESNVELIYTLDRLNIQVLQIIYNWVIAASELREFKIDSKIFKYLDTLCLPVSDIRLYTLPAELR